MTTIDRFYGDPIERFRAMASDTNTAETIDGAHFRMWCRIAAEEIEFRDFALRKIAFLRSAGATPKMVKGELIESIEKIALTACKPLRRDANGNVIPRALASIYVRQNGGFGSTCDGVRDTGHHIVGEKGLFSVWSIHDDDKLICEAATCEEAEKAIAIDWHADAATQP